MQLDNQRQKTVGSMLGVLSRTLKGTICLRLTIKAIALKRQNIICQKWRRRVPKIWRPFEMKKARFFMTESRFRKARKMPERGQDQTRFQTNQTREDFTCGRKISDMNLLLARSLHFDNAVSMMLLHFHSRPPLKAEFGMSLTFVGSSA